MLQYVVHAVVDTLELSRAWNRYDPGLLREQPGERDLRSAQESSLSAVDGPADTASGGIPAPVALWLLTSREPRKAATRGGQGSIARKSMQKPIAVLVVTLTLCTAAAPGAAQGVSAIADLSLEELMEIEITTASLTTETVGNAPARVEVITAAQIERRGYTSLVDVLKDLPDFKVDLAGDPDYPTELVVQGARGASSIVLLLDGIQVSSPTDEPLPILANYPVHNARQVEIVYGPASALYGADAFAAVINIITNDALDASGLAVSGSVGQYGVTSDTVSYGRRFGRVGLTMAGQIFYDRQPDLSRFYPEAFGGLTAQRTGIFPTIFGPMVSPRPVSRAYDIPTSARSVQVGLSVGRLRVMLFENYSRVSTAPPINPDNAVYNEIGRAHV